jgi:hypothetical protein
MGWGIEVSSIYISRKSFIILLVYILRSLNRAINKRYLNGIEVPIIPPLNRTSTFQFVRGEFELSSEVTATKVGTVFLKYISINTYRK